MKVEDLKEKVHMDMTVLEMGKYQHEVSLSLKGNVCHNGILKAMCYKQDYWEMF